MPKIRTVFQPDRVQEVDDAEAEQLRRDGLLLDDEPKPDTAKAGTSVTASAAVPSAPKEAPADGGK